MTTPSPTTTHDAPGEAQYRNGTGRSLDILGARVDGGIELVRRAGGSSTWQRRKWQRTRQTRRYEWYTRQRWQAQRTRELRWCERSWQLGPACCRCSNAFTSTLVGFGDRSRPQREVRALHQLVGYQFRQRVRWLAGGPINDELNDVVGESFVIVIEAHESVRVAS